MNFIPHIFAAAVGVVCSGFGTIGFVRSIRRERGEKASGIEWFISTCVGIAIGAAAFSLLN